MQCLAEETASTVFQLPTSCAPIWKPKLNIGQAEEVAPHHEIAGWSVLGTSQVTAEPSDFGQLRE